MRPFYFGDKERPLFGIYHPPEGPRARDASVLLCGPAPQEYMSSHWALRRLAVALASAGFHVLRFDYFGTGDSAGETRDGTLDQWRLDIAQAALELEDVSGARRLSVVGLRLGAALAAEAAFKVRDLLLWEPVIDGRAYLSELRKSHRRLFAHCLYPPRVGPPGAMGEVNGFLLTAAQEQATSAVDLERSFACAAERVTLVCAPWRAAALARARLLKRRLEERGVHVELDVLEEEASVEAEAFPLSNQAQQVIASRLAGRPA